MCLVLPCSSDLEIYSLHQIWKGFRHYLLKIYFTYQSFLLGLPWNEYLASGHCSLSPETLPSPPPHLPAPCNFTSDHGLGQLVNFALCQAHRCFRSSSLSWLELGLSAEMFILLPFHSKNFVLLFSSHSFSFYAKNSPFQLFRSVHIHYMEHGFNSCFLV